jgi:hypothetical protein
MSRFQIAVIAFILRVFPSIVENPPVATFLSSLSSPVTLISLLGDVDTHICKYADFILQCSFVHFFLLSVSYQLPVRMAAIHQLLRDNEQVAMLFSLLITPHAVPQSSTQIDPLCSWFHIAGGTRFPSLTLYTDPQRPEFPNPSPSSVVNDFMAHSASPPLRSSLQDLSNLHPSVSEATMSLQKSSLSNFSRSYSASDILVALAEVSSTSVQGAPPVQSNRDTDINEEELQNTTRTLSPSLFTPDPNASTPTMKAETPVSLTEPDLLGLDEAQASSFSSILSDLPQPQTQFSSPVSSQVFTILDNPFYNTFQTATEAPSSKRKLGYTLDSSPARRMRMSTPEGSNDTASILVVEDLAHPLLPKPKPSEGKENDDMPTMLVKKMRGRSKDRVVSNNIHSIAGRVQKKRAVSMHSTNKENRSEVEG